MAMIKFRTKYYWNCFGNAFMLMPINTSLGLVPRAVQIIALNIDLCVTTKNYLPVIFKESIRNSKASMKSTDIQEAAITRAYWCKQNQEKF